MSDSLLFGETAVARGFITPDQLAVALKRHREGPGVPLGAIMVNLGLITLPQATAIEKLNAALRLKQGQQIGEDQDVVGLTLGGCLVLERLATGSMGTTYRAHHMRLDRDVVVKVLHPRMVDIEGNLTRFAREARAAAALEHPAIVSVYDFDTDGGYHFIVMQYIKGQDLRQVLEERGALGPRRALWICARVLEGLQHAHANQVVHRDIKPANLMITPEPRIKIADFGLVRILSLTTSEEISVFGEIIGTPQYMAPEQACGDDFDWRADLYSLGITTFELIAGRPPFTGNSTMEVLEKHIMDPMPSIRDFDATATEQLDAFLKKLCAKKPDDRFADAAEALAEVQTMRFTGETQRLTAADRKAAPDPSRLGDGPPIVTEAALEQLKSRLNASNALVAFEDGNAAVDTPSDARRDMIDASFSGVDVASTALADARRLLKEATDTPKEQVPALLQKMLKDGQNDEVIALAPDLNRLLPDSVAVAFYLGEALYNSGQLENARSKFALATVLAPDHLQARLHLARVLVALERVDDAIDALREAGTWHSTSLQVAVRLAEVLYVVKNDREAAVPAYERAIELAPSRWQLRQQLAWILYELAQYERAESVLTEVVAWQNDAEPAKKLLEQIRRKRSRRTKRLKKKKPTRTVTQSSPKPGAGESKLGQVEQGRIVSACMSAIRLAKAGKNWSRVLELAETGLESENQSVPLLLAKANALLGLGKPSAAVAAYGLALAIDPNNEQAHEGLMKTQSQRRASRRLKKRGKKNKTSDE
jgi:tetratricopeptide (TPR) repeat protein/tRNA A-37 threonylcarbamoyl transferase component Bud32